VGVCGGKIDKCICVRLGKKIREFKLDKVCVSLKLLKESEWELEMKKFGVVNGQLVDSLR
jgi:hypothetical protein